MQFWLQLGFLSDMMNINSYSKEVAQTEKGEKMLAQKQIKKLWVQAIEKVDAAYSVNENPPEVAVNAACFYTRLYPAVVAEAAETYYAALEDN